MAICRYFIQRRSQGAGGILRVVATAFFDGNHKQKAHMTKGRVSLRQLHFLIFLAWPASRDSGASKVMVRSIIMGGVAYEMTKSGLRMDPGKTLLFTIASWPASVMVFTISSNTRS